jgi:hypothetical protein
MKTANMITTAAPIHAKALPKVIVFWLFIEKASGSRRGRQSGPPGARSSSDARSPHRRDCEPYSGAYGDLRTQ